MSEHGPTASYRGYRLQALYALSRILATNQDEKLTYIPEGLEDLEVREASHLIEIVQVKSYDGLSLSDLEPSKAGSFFHRAADYVLQDPRPRIRIVNFGPIGTELEKAWAGEVNARESVTHKLIGHGFSPEIVSQFFDGIELIPVEEPLITEQVNTQLKNLMTGVDPGSAFKLLHNWLFNLSEKRVSVTIDSLIEELNTVGRFLAERSHYHTEWFTNIIPVEDENIETRAKEALQKEFYEGISVRYEHILADLDFLRTGKMQSISGGFKESNVVIIHGASGQGKSTLAYRYLRDFYSEQCRYQIRLIENRQHALRTATALSGYAKALQIPMIVYVDVSSRDRDWIDLVVQLNRQSFIQTLVTIREEDFRRTNLPSHLDFQDVHLEFNEEEARQIYERAKISGLPLTYLTFEDAWETFGEEGPLLEFVYLLTQTTTLRQRLEEQVKRLQEEVREKKLASGELHLLRLVSVITAYGGRLNISLLNSLEIPEPAITMQYYEKEYLIRVSQDGLLIEALHPLRSSILSDLLTEPGINPWIDLVAEGLRYVPEDDWEAFILHALIRQPGFFDDILATMNDLNPETWIGIAGLIRCFIWAGIRLYLNKNQQVVQDSRRLMKNGWYFVPDLNLTGEDDLKMSDWWDGLGKLMPDDTKSEIKRIRDSQTPKNEIVQLAETWLRGVENPPVPPKTAKAWTAVAEVLYWASRFKCADKVLSWITDDSLSYAVDRLTLSELSDVSFALYQCNSERYAKWINAHLDKVNIRLVEEYQILLMEDKDDARIIHFLTYPEDQQVVSESQPDEEKSIHDKTMDRIRVVRQLFPSFSKYGSRGYGHQLFEFQNLHDDSLKAGIPTHRLPPKWAVRVNGAIVGLQQNQFRPDTWYEYIQSILDLRSQIVRNVNGLNLHLARYFQAQSPGNFLSAPPFSTGEWDRTKGLAEDLPLLPITAVDPWGFGRPEGVTKENLQSPELLPQSILQEKYKPYQEAERKFFTSLTGFMQQAIHVSVVNIRAGKLIDTSPQKKAIIAELESKGIELKNHFLSKINLWEAFSNLGQYQNQFRTLFATRVANEILEEIEKREIQSFENILMSWLIFVDNPRTTLSNPKKQIVLTFDRRHQRLSETIEDSLKSMDGDSVMARIVNTDLSWDGEPALWIHIDVQTPLEIYQKVEDVIYRLRDSFGSMQYGDSDYFLVELKCRRTVIIPTVQGKMVEEKVWPLQTSLTLTSDHAIEDKPYLYVPYNIPRSVREKLGFDIWKVDDRFVIAQFETSFNELMMRLSLISKMTDVPEFPDALLPTLEIYMQNRSKEISKALQTFFDSATVLVNRFNDLPDEEKSERDHLQEAIQALTHLTETVLPKGGVTKLSVKEMADYASLLKENVSIVQYIKMTWLYDSLGAQ